MFFPAKKKESMNKRISKFAPKTMTFCRSLSLKDRVYWAVCIDSIGYKIAAAKVATEMESELMPTMMKSWENQDKDRTYRQAYSSTPQFKMNRKKIQ
jgi:hypothetical protein